LITTEGKTHIKRYMAGWVPSIAQSIAVGIGGKAENVDDTKLQLEVARADITVTSFDFANNKLVFKAPVPETFGGSIYEVALYSASADAVAGQYGSKLLTTFDEDVEDWNKIPTLEDSTYSTGTARIGSDALQQSAGAGSSVTDGLAEMFLDLSGHSGLDRFVFAFHAHDANIATLTFRFMTDSSNYYDIVIGSQAPGYRIVEVPKSSAVATGSPKWENITEIRIITTAGAGGNALVDFDAIRIDDADTVNPDYIMVAREFLLTPFVKEEGKVQEVEFTLDVNIP